ncbi:MAG TPA: amidase [Conexibacter sp.]
MAEPLHALTIAEAGRLLRAREVSSVELVEASARRATALDHLGVYVSRFDAEALAAARHADRELAAGHDRGPLHGIPLGVKDIIATAEGPTSANSQAFGATWGRGQYAPAVFAATWGREQDAPVVARLRGAGKNAPAGAPLACDAPWGGGNDALVVARLRAAGAVITGKTTTMEFAYGPPDPAKPFPLPRNPWDADTWPGGSSSGSGAGVAAGLFPGALGTDTAGSIRLPAAACGVTGLMATFGRVPVAGCVPLAYSLDRVGPLARTAHDCGLLLSAIAGPAPTDPTSLATPAANRLAEAGWSLGRARIGADGARSLAGLRIGVDPLAHVSAQRDSALDPALEAALATLEGLGAELVEVELPLYAELAAVVLATLSAEAFAYHLPRLRERWDDFGAQTRVMLAAGGLVSAADYVQAQRVRRHALRELAALFTQVDLIATPTAARAAPRYEGAQPPPLKRIFDGPCTHYWNPFGNPVMASPIGFNAEALPLSIQLAAPPFAEPLLIAVGDAYQRVTDWHTRLAPAAPPPTSQARSASASPATQVAPPAQAATPADAAAPADQAGRDADRNAFAADSLRRAGLSLSDDELEQAAAFHPREQIAALHDLNAVRDEPPALGFDPAQPLTAWPA